MRIIYLPDNWTILLCFIVWPLIQVAAALFCLNLPDRIFSSTSFLFRPHRFEKHGRIYDQIFCVRRWKHLLPDGGMVWKKRGFKKKHLDNFSEENREKELREFQNIQKVYLEKGYELELEQKIRETLEIRGIEVYKVKVNIEGEETQANLVLKTEISQEERKELKDALVEEWGLKENRICIQIVRNESGKMGNPVAHRSTSGSSGDACIQ